MSRCRVRLRRCARCCKPEPGRSRCGARAEIVAWNRKEGLPSARLPAATSSAWPKTTATFSTTAWTRSTPARSSTRRFVATTREAGRKACPVCGYQPMGKRCVSCGHEVIKAISRRARHGEMQEIRIGKTKYADDKRHLWEQACSYARGYSAPDKQQGEQSTSSATSRANGQIARGTLPQRQAYRSLALCSTRSSRATSHTRNLSGRARHERDDTNRVCHFFHPGDRPRTVGRDRDGCQKRSSARPGAICGIPGVGRQSLTGPESAKAVWRSIKSSDGSLWPLSITTPKRMAGATTARCNRFLRARSLSAGRRP